jgi:hypothetical protein
VGLKLIYREDKAELNTGPRYGPVLMEKSGVYNAWAAASIVLCQLKAILDIATML